MIEVTVRCGCSRPMRPDTFGGPGRYVCSCGAKVALSGLPKLDASRCTTLKGKRFCNAPKLPEAITCEPCAVVIAAIALDDPEVARQLAAKHAGTEYYHARKAEFERLQADASLIRIDRRPGVPRAGVVYYAELRPGIVKIGTTLDLVSRMSSLHIPDAAVLAAEPGHYEQETARHAEFAHVRIGRREDFMVDDALRAHIDGLAAEHGDPFALATRLRNELQKLAQYRNSELSSANVVIAG